MDIVPSVVLHTIIYMYVHAICMYINYNLYLVFMLFVHLCRFIFAGLASGNVAVLTTHFWMQ